MRNLRDNKHFTDDYRKISRLENLLERERYKLKKALFMKDYLYNSLEGTKEELKSCQLRCEMQEEEYNKKIAELTKENIELRKRVSIRDNNESKINEIYTNLNRIHVKAEADAADLINDAKGKVMEIFFVTDKMDKQVDSLKKDMKSLEKDLAIGPATMIERVNAFYDDINKYKSKIKEMKRKFYKENKVPLDLSD